VLRLKFKLVGTEGFVNGGVQVRSKHVKNPPFELSGYQADMGDPEWWGCIYDESRRNKVVAKSDIANWPLMGRLGRAANTLFISRENKREIQDGPFANTKEQLGGFTLLELPSLDAALEWAARCPAASYGVVEVRPIAVEMEPRVTVANSN